jgi:hypothetical protein
MAEQSVHDVVNQTLSVGDLSPSDANEAKSIHIATGGDDAVVGTRRNGQEETRSEQDGTTFHTDSTSYVITNGQHLVCSGAVCPISGSQTYIVNRTNPVVVNLI